MGYMYKGGPEKLLHQLNNAFCKPTHGQYKSSKLALHMQLLMQMPLLNKVLVMHKIKIKTGEFLHDVSAIAIKMTF